MNTSTHVIATEIIDDLKASLNGRVILPDSQDYDEARAVWNGMIDRYPAIIVRCEDVSDVIAAVKAARSADLLVSVRGGGHNVAGHATNDGGMVIDLSPMRQISVDPERRTASAQGGATWADLDAATQPYGLATPGGEVSETGIAGLTLGGGMGYLRRKHGLSCDNVLSVDVVTADAELLHADASENADLYWAVRGGGGNFGIVTRFEYQLHPIGPEVATATALYPFESAARIMQAWQRYTLTAPDEVTSAFGFWAIPPIPDFPEELHHRPVALLDAVYCGPLDQADEALRPLRQMAEPLVDLGGVSPFVEVQRGFDAFFPARIQRYYWKSLNLRTITNELIDTVIAQAAKRPSPQTVIFIRHLGGAMGRIPAEATAFGDRSAQYNLSLDSTWIDPADDARNITWTRFAWETLYEFSDGGVYLNFPGFMEEGEKLIRGQFGRNYQRLAQIKARYDPTNFFRLNQNIKPG